MSNKESPKAAAAALQEALKNDGRATLTDYFIYIKDVLDALPPEEAMEDLRTHRDAWYRALLIAKTGAQINPDEVVYWTHEIAAFNRTFDALVPKPIEIPVLTAEDMDILLHGDRIDKVRLLERYTMRAIAADRKARGD